MKSKNKFVGINIAPPFPHFAPSLQNPHLSQEVLKIHANSIYPISALNVRESPKFSHL